MNFKDKIRQRAVQDGVSIDQVPDLDGLADRFRAALERCAEDEDVSVVPDRLFVVGSFARGTAERGESDLDAVVTFRSPDGDELSPDFDAATTGIVVCIQSRLTFRVLTPEQHEWIEGIDVSDTKPANELLTLERFTQETRDDRPLGTQRVYDLDNQQYVSRSEITSQLADSGGRGQLS